MILVKKDNLRRKNVLDYIFKTYTERLVNLIGSFRVAQALLIKRLLLKMLKNRVPIRLTLRKLTI